MHAARGGDAFMVTSLCGLCRDGRSFIHKVHLVEADLLAGQAERNVSKKFWVTTPAKSLPARNICVTCCKSEAFANCCPLIFFFAFHEILLVIVANEDAQLALV